MQEPIRMTLTEADATAMNGETSVQDLAVAGEATGTLADSSAENTAMLQELINRMAEELKGKPLPGMDGKSQRRARRTRERAAKTEQRKAQRAGMRTLRAADIIEYKRRDAERREQLAKEIGR